MVVGFGGAPCEFVGLFGILVTIACTAFNISQKLGDVYSKILCYVFDFIYMLRNLSGSSSESSSSMFLLAKARFRAAKVKSEVARRVANKKTHVNIELRNGDKLKGRIQQADDSKFTIRQDKTGNNLELSYNDVLKVKGQGLGTGAKIGIVVGIAVVVVAVTVVVALKNFDPFTGGIRVP